MSNQKYDNRSPQKPSLKRSNMKDLCNTTSDSDNSRSSSSSNNSADLESYKSCCVQRSSSPVSTGCCYSAYEWLKIKEEITCSICGDLFTDPKIVPCLHTFCKFCLEKFIEMNKKLGNEVCCPLCCARLQIHEVNLIPTNFTIKTLMEIYGQQQKYHFFAEQDMSDSHENSNSFVSHTDSANLYDSSIVNSFKECSQTKGHNYKIAIGSLADSNSAKQYQQTFRYKSNYVPQCQTGRKMSTPSRESSNIQAVQSVNSHNKPVLQLRSKIVAYVSDPHNGAKLQYDQLEDRTKTYTLPPPWEGPVDVQLMAEAGFVYTGQEDLVYCFSCKIKLDGWTKHMDPLLRHKEDSPTCSFVRQQLQVIKGEKKKVKSVVAPSKPLNPQQTASIGQLQSQASTVYCSKPIHTVVTGLDESRLSYSASRGSESVDDYSMHLPINVKNYGSEEERLKSFTGWPLNESIHPEQLTRVGFVYTGEGSLVQCFQCGVRYRNWLKGDVPLSVHQKCNPRCAFLNELNRKGKSIEEQKPSFSFIQPEGMSSSSLNENVTLEFPTYDNEATRLLSFKYWGGILPKEELAEAGFYMIARRDVVRCFSCHVVLQDWEITDNVIEEHQRHSPRCPFLTSYLYSISASSCASSSINKSYSMEKSFEIKSRDYRSPQFDTTLKSLSSLGIKQPLSKEKSSCEPSVAGFIVNEGLNIRTEGLSSITEGLSSRTEELSSRTEGLPLRNEDSLLRSEALPRSIDNTEQPTGIRYPPSYAYNPPTTISPPPGSSDSEESTSSQKKLDYMTSLQQSIAATSKTKQIVYEESLSQGLEEKNISMRTTEDKSDDDTSSPAVGGLCQICYDKKIECIFLPCGHARTCEECATRIKNSGQPCPYCRKSVSTTHRIYL